MYENHQSTHSGPVIWGPRAGIECNVRLDDFVYAPNIGYELSGLPLAVRASAIAYISKATIDVRLVPEAGFSFFGLLNLTYGYCIPILESRVADISRHRVTLTANLDVDLWNEL